MAFPTFQTLDQHGNKKTWTYHSPKKGGANGAGQYGGFFKDSLGNTCLIKQDSRIHLNIAEFLAGKIYQHLAREVSAPLQLVRVNEGITISADGQNVYLVSEFIPHWNDLYNEVQVFLNRPAGRSKIKMVEIMQLVDQLILRRTELADFFSKGTENGNYCNFGEIAATSLLINNTDTNLGNVGVTTTPDGVKKLAIIDYGAAFRNMTPKINPHSFKKYLASHTLNHEGWNNFLYYPESIKITPDFVFQLDTASKANLKAVIDQAFTQIAQHYGIRPIVEFAVRAGASMPLREYALAQLENNPRLAEQKIKQIKKAIFQSLKQRQQDLARFSAQIKMDMCVQEEAAPDKSSLGGAFVDKDGRTVTLSDVIFDHFDYFKEIALGLEKFKFRKSVHKQQPHLIQEVENKARVILASFILVEENQAARESHNINTMEDAINALQNERLSKTTLYNMLDTKLLPRAKVLFLDFEKSRAATKLNTVLNIITKASVSKPEGITLERLSKCEKLQDAIIELDKRCYELQLSYNNEQKNALSIYKKDMIQLALAGVERYKRGYATVEQQAIQAIDHSTFNICVRHLGNIIYLAVMAASVIGLVTLIYHVKKGHDLLLFPGPRKELSEIADRFEDIPSDPEFSAINPN